jgi:formate dehydrogenase subunit beta
MKIRLPVKNNDPLKALQQFLRQLITEHIVDLLMLPMRTLHGSVTQALVSDPDLLVQADPLAPVMPVNSATLVGQVSLRPPRPKLGVVLRSCEARALIELVKLQQASMDDLLLICVDCAGTLSVPEYMLRIHNNMAGNGASGNSAIWKDLFFTALQHPDASPEILRPACQMCDQPVYDQAQIVVELFNSDLNQEIIISLPDDLGARLDYNHAETINRAAAMDNLLSARAKRRDAEIATIQAKLEGEERITGIFAACIRCHNCMTVCPMCYCKTCVFKSQVFEHEPMQYVSWAQQKGAYRMPADTTLFHLTRLNHMALSCVGCGMCTEACPSNLPVGTVFRTIGHRLQETFNYLPGRDKEEKLPLTTFKADEWTQMGE